MRLAPAAAGPLDMPAAGDDGSAAAHAFPLRVGSWVALAADLTQPGWMEDLQAHGWQLVVPTVWVVEGVSGPAPPVPQPCRGSCRQQQRKGFPHAWLVVPASCRSCTT